MPAPKPNKSSGGAVTLANLITHLRDAFELVPEKEDVLRSTGLVTDDAAPQPDAVE